MNGEIPFDLTYGGQYVCVCGPDKEIHIGRTSDGEYEIAVTGPMGRFPIQTVKERFESSSEAHAWLNDNFDKLRTRSPITPKDIEELEDLNDARMEDAAKVNRPSPSERQHEQDMVRQFEDMVQQLADDLFHCATSYDGPDPEPTVYLDDMLPPEPRL